MPEANLELTCTVLEYLTFDGTEKQANGRIAQYEFMLNDCETGFCESSIVYGEGIDKGDKAGYKAYTGALKYFLANTFMVATGDDPETESPDEKMNYVSGGKKATPKQIEVLAKTYVGDDLDRLLQFNNISRLEDISMAKASELIGKLGGRR